MYKHKLGKRRLCEVLDSMLDRRNILSLYAVRPWIKLRRIMRRQHLNLFSLSFASHNILIKTLIIFAAVFEIPYDLHKYPMLVRNLLLPDFPTYPNLLEGLLRKVQF